jgi:hypothetical protein
MCSFFCLVLILVMTRQMLCAFPSYNCCLLSNSCYLVPLAGTSLCCSRSRCGTRCARGCSTCGRAPMPTCSRRTTSTACRTRGKGSTACSRALTSAALPVDFCTMFSRRAAAGLASAWSTLVGLRHSLHSRHVLLPCCLIA